MEESLKKTQMEGGDKEILYSKAIKAGKRIYYLDVKRNLKDDLFLAITESKKVQNRENAGISFEKHKIFLYKEDFDKFLQGMEDVISYIKNINRQRYGEETESPKDPVEEEVQMDSEIEEFKINIDF